MTEIDKDNSNTTNNFLIDINSKVVSSEDSSRLQQLNTKNSIKQPNPLSPKHLNTSIDLELMQDQKTSAKSTTSNQNISNDCNNTTIMTKHNKSPSNYLKLDASCKTIASTSSCFINDNSSNLFFILFLIMDCITF